MSPPFPTSDVTEAINTPSSTTCSSAWTAALLWLWANTDTCWECMLQTNAVERHPLPITNATDANCSISKPSPPVTFGTAAPIRPWRRTSARFSTENRFNLSAFTAPSNNCERLASSSEVNIESNMLMVLGTQLRSTGYAPYRTFRR
ncbi:hypothetical protein D3C84_316190 [compost metagenome]